MDLTGKSLHTVFLFGEQRSSSVTWTDHFDHQRQVYFSITEADVLEMFMSYDDREDQMWELPPGKFTLVPAFWSIPIAWFCESRMLVPRSADRRWRPYTGPRDRFWRGIPDNVASRTRGALLEQTSDEARRARWKRQDRKRKRRL